MKLRLFGLLCIFSSSLLAQIPYSISKQTVLAGAAEVVTVQQPASNSLIVEFKTAYVACTAACTFTLERDGTAATGTTLAPTAVNPSRDPASTTNGFYSSDVGAGTVIGRYQVSAGGGIVLDLSKVNIYHGGTSSNLSIRTNSITGTVNIVITYTER